MAGIHDARCSVTDLADVCAFLYREADYLDKADLDGWFELYTEDATYWMPVSPEQTDPLSHISLFYDDRLMGCSEPAGNAGTRAPSSGCSTARTAGF